MDPQYGWKVLRAMAYFEFGDYSLDVRPYEYFWLVRHLAQIRCLSSIDLLASEDISAFHKGTVLPAFTFYGCPMVLVGKLVIRKRLIDNPVGLIEDSMSFDMSGWISYL